jgi:hypothetical protein
MSNVIFLKDLKSQMNISDKITIKKRRYDWGNLRVIHVGISFTIVIHPEN